MWLPLPTFDFFLDLPLIGARRTYVEHTRKISFGVRKRTRKEKRLVFRHDWLLLDLFNKNDERAFVVWLRSLQELVWQWRMQKGKRSCWWWWVWQKRQIFLINEFGPLSSLQKRPASLFRRYHGGTPSQHHNNSRPQHRRHCLLYTSDAADE